MKPQLPASPLPRSYVALNIHQTGRSQSFLRHSLPGNWGRSLSSIFNWVPALDVEKTLVGLLLTLFIATGIAYSLIVPPFETPDEIYHYAFARHLAAGNGLPVQGPLKTGPWEQEGSQPPLYYSLVGLATAGIDQNDFYEFAVLNPRANLGNPESPGNKNFILYSAQQRPLRGVNLAVRIGRWLSLLMGTLTVLLTYLLARYAFPNDRWSCLLATGLVATVPQFTFISASVSNDSIVSALSTAVLVYLAALTERARRQKIRWWAWIGLGLLLGLAALSKLQGLGLLPLTGIFALLIARLQKDKWTVLRSALLIGASVLIVAGWWYVRNLQLYGDLFGIENLISVNGKREEAVTWPALVGELQGLEMSFWGIFGWFSILLPHWTYSFFELLTAVAIVGAVAPYLRSWRGLRGALRLRDQAASVKGLALLWALLSFAMLASWISISLGAQGRLLFPAISVLAIIAATGLRYWVGFLPHSMRALVGVAVPLALWGCSFYALTILLPQSYGFDSEARSVAAVPADVQPIGKVYGDGVELVAIRLPDHHLFAGEQVPVTLYFRTQKSQRQDHELFLHLLDSNGIQIGNVTTHPGLGVWPLTLWQPGVIYEDTYQISLERRSPALARLYVGFTDPTSTALESEGLLPVVGGGPRIESRVIWTFYDHLEPLAVHYDSGITLQGVALGQNEDQLSSQKLLDLGQDRNLWVALNWQTAPGSEIDYAISLRLYRAGQEGEWVYDEDNAIWNPNRVSTGNEKLSERFDSLTQLDFPTDLPAGDYELRLIVYNAETLQPTVVVDIWEPDFLLARLLLE